MFLPCRMVTAVAGSGGLDLTPRPVLFREEVNVYPVCLHLPQHSLDMDQQMRFVHEIRPAVQEAVERVSRHMVSSVVLKPKLMKSVSTQTLPVNLPGPGLTLMAPL